MTCVGGNEDIPRIRPLRDHLGELRLEMVQLLYVHAMGALTDISLNVQAKMVGLHLLMIFKNSNSSICTSTFVILPWQYIQAGQIFRSRFRYVFTQLDQAEHCAVFRQIWEEFRLPRLERTALALPNIRSQIVERLPSNVMPTAMQKQYLSMQDFRYDPHPVPIFMFGQIP